MMKMVKFTRPMLGVGGAGEQKALPAEIADRLIENGEAEFVPSVFDAVAAPAGSRRPKLYLTRDKKAG